MAKSGTIDQQRAAAQAQEARHAKLNGELARKTGLRMRFTAIPGVTGGDASKVLATPYYFQNAPMDSFAITRGKTVNRYTDYTGRERSQAAGKTLVPVTFRTLLVEWAGFIVDANFDVAGHVDRLGRLAEAPYPVRFLATHPYNDDPEADLAVLIQSIVFTENAAEVDARYVDITMVEWESATTTVKGTKKTRGGGPSYPYTIRLHPDGSYVRVDKQGHYAQFGVLSTYPDFADPLSFSLIAQIAYGKPSLAKHVALAQKPPMKDFGLHSSLVLSQRFKKGGTIVVPAPPAD